MSYLYYFLKRFAELSRNMRIFWWIVRDHRASNLNLIGTAERATGPAYTVTSSS